MTSGKQPGVTLNKTRRLFTNTPLSLIMKTINVSLFIKHVF